MKRLLLALAFLLAAPLGAAAQAFVRITAIDELTENADYVIGGKAQDTRPFYLLTATLEKGRFAGMAYASSAPDELPADCGAALFRLVREGDRLVLHTAGGYVHAPKPKETAVSLTALQHTAWEVRVEQGQFTLTSGGRCFSIYSERTQARFGYYAPSSFEGPLCLYKREQAPESLTAYERFWEADGCETLCLPFACTVPQPFTAYAVSEGSGDQPTYTPTTSLGAGQPAVIKGPKGLLFRVEAVGPPAAAPQPAYLTGTFRPLRLNQGRVLTDQGFEPVAEGCFLPAFRAYLK